MVDVHVEAKIPDHANAEVALFGLGCLWGVENRFWRIPCVIVTAVSYAGGLTPNPTLCGGVLRPHRAQRGRARGLRSEAREL